MPKPYKKERGGATKAVKHASPCKYYQRGKCNNVHCPYLHVAEKGVIGASSAALAEGKGGAASDVLSSVLRLFLEREFSTLYNAETRMLNLNAFAAHEGLRDIASGIDFNTRTFCEALCECIASCVTPPPSILSLEENAIASVYHLARTMEEANLHTSVQAISLARNRIKTCDFAKELKGFTSLVELNVLDNPATELTDYRQKLKKLLPFIRILDTLPLSARPLALPWPAFYSVHEVEGPTANHPQAQAYDSIQKGILQFVKTAVLDPLEQDPDSAPSGTVTGVDAVSEAYSLNACLSISLSRPEAAVAAPPSTLQGSGANGGVELRNTIREIVGLRIRQTESDHNLIRGSGTRGKGVSSSTPGHVARGRTQVCAQLEHWLYPKAFSVSHCIHASPDVAVLDNSGVGPNAAALMKEPVSVVTLHGVMVWRYRQEGPHSKSHHSPGSPANRAGADRGLVLIKRNFSRVLTVVVAGSSDKWQIANDMVTLYPFSGAAAEEEEADSDVAAAASALRTCGGRNDDDDDGRLRGMGGGLEGGGGLSSLVLYHPYEVLFSPATDPRRVVAFSHQYRVPIPVVARVTVVATSDAELVSVLADVQGVPLAAFERCAGLASGDPMAGVFLCRLQNTYGVDAATTGVQLVSQYGLNWAAIQAAVQPPL